MVMPLSSSPPPPPSPAFRYDSLQLSSLPSSPLTPLHHHTGYYNRHQHHFSPPLTAFITTIIHLQYSSPPQSLLITTATLHHHHYHLLITRTPVYVRVSPPRRQHTLAAAGWFLCFLPYVAQLFGALPSSHPPARPCLPTPPALIQYPVSR